MSSSSPDRARWRTPSMRDGSRRRWCTNEPQTVLDDSLARGSLAHGNESGRSAVRPGVEWCPGGPPASRSATSSGSRRGANTMSRPPPRSRRASTSAARGRRSARSLLPRQAGPRLERLACARGTRCRAGRPSDRRGTARCAAASRCCGPISAAVTPSSSSSSRRSVASSSSPGSWPPPGVAHTVTSGNSKRTSRMRSAGSSTRARTDDRMRRPSTSHRRRAGYSTGLSGRSPLKARYIS